jgi:hypothetical protein
VRFSAAFDRQGARFLAIDPHVCEAFFTFPIVVHGRLSVVKARRAIPIVLPLNFCYGILMNRLTRQEQMMLCIVLGLLLTGWAVKAYRTAHPSAAAESTQH